MFQEFKAFAIRGNVVDMAVGIAIGVAFSAIVNSTVNDILMPVVALLTGGADFSNKFWVLREGAATAPYLSLAAAKEAGAVVVAYGMLINAIVNFAIVAAVLFLAVRGINNLRRQEAVAPTAPPAPTKEEVLLTEIRDLLARR